MKYLFLLTIATLFLIFSTAGCGATKGVGEDIENAGQSIQKAADKNS